MTTASQIEAEAAKLANEAISLNNSNNIQQKTLAIIDLRNELS